MCTFWNNTSVHYNNQEYKDLERKTNGKKLKFRPKTHDTRKKSESPTSKTGKVDKGKLINNKLNRF